MPHTQPGLKRGKGTKRRFLTLKAPQIPFIPERLVKPGAPPHVNQMGYPQAPVTQRFKDPISCWKVTGPKLPRFPDKIGQI